MITRIIVVLQVYDGCCTQLYRPVVISFPGGAILKVKFGPSSMKVINLIGAATKTKRMQTIVRVLQVKR